MSEMGKTVPVKKLNGQASCCDYVGMSRYMTNHSPPYWKSNVTHSSNFKIIDILLSKLVKHWLIAHIGLCLHLVSNLILE